ncbi:MAG: PVC-type heme-binding CxxCH protein [Sphingobacteriaceae bacterium]
MNIFRLSISLLFSLVITAHGYSFSHKIEYRQTKDTTKVDREYALEATMLGYFAPDGSRNPVLFANKGDVVRITITNGELMTHDITMEIMGIKSKVLIEKGSTASISFKADKSDTYFCSIPGHRAAGMVGKFEVVEGKITNVVNVKGLLPKKDGKTLNLNFETGTLQDWKATGDAFSNPLVSSDPSPMHEKDMHIGMEGKFFVSSGGTKNYTRTGTLTSVPFKVTQPFAAFLVSGGALQDTRIELVRADNDSVFFQITGTGRATLQPVVVDLKPILNKEIYIRLVDNETGISQIPYIGNDIWGHINFDDFLFYSVRPEFPNELKKSDIIILPPLDPVLNAGLSGEKAAQAMSPKKGFSITLAAAEPDIVRPISFTLDSRGRLWVVEAHTYPVRAPEGQGKDRIIIFEDTNGDGKLDKRKVFMEGLNLVSSIELGFGGVWLGAAPYLMFIPIDEKTDKPAGPPQILLDGFGLNDTHEILNNLRWGPDGWLYGTHGIFTQSNVGKPGTPDAQRIKLNAGVWRFHPTTKKFEVFAEGTSNPWGIDWNDYGQPFVTVCVIPHMFHIIQGARYMRQAGNHYNPYTYDDIGTIADHVHWVGDRGPHAGNFRSGAKGGGHAHAGAMIYLGGDSWPKEYHNNIFMNNINGSRVNVDLLSRKGSGYTAAHGEDFLLTNDSWSQWLNFRYDPSGSVFAIDWYDKNQCHSPNPDVHDKTMGRIFKITYENDKWVKVDLSKATDMELVNYQLNKNEWYVRQARLILQERGPNKKVHKALKNILTNNPDVTRKLRALWALYVTEGLKEKDLLALLTNDSEYVRGWAIQLLAEDENLSETAITKFADMAHKDSSSLVRLYLASAIQRTEPLKRWDILDGLLAHAEDVNDHNLPLMLWYAAEPLVTTDLDRSVNMAIKAKFPKILTYTIQRIGVIGTPESKKTLEALNQRFDKMDNPHQYHEQKTLIDKLLK